MKILNTGSFSGTCYHMRHFAWHSGSVSEWDIDKPQLTTNYQWWAK